MNPSANHPAPDHQGPHRPDLPRREAAGPASPEEWEQLRRSVAMLSPGAWALKREPALLALNLLLNHLRAARADPPGPLGSNRL